MNNDKRPQGAVIWITGFSGAGKSTVARELRARLQASGVSPLLLDGDVMRAVLAREAGFSREERRELAWIYARLCHEVATQGIPVICATISMVHEVREWNRINNFLYYEIYLKVSLPERAARDPKGLYARGGTDGAKGSMVGMDEAAEEPHAPDLIIENAGLVTAGAAADQIWQLLKDKQGVYANSC